MITTTDLDNVPVDNQNLQTVSVDTLNSDFSIALQIPQTQEIHFSQHDLRVHLLLTHVMQCNTKLMPFFLTFKQPQGSLNEEQRKMLQNEIPTIMCLLKSCINENQRPEPTFFKALKETAGLPFSLRIQASLSEASAMLQADTSHLASNSADTEVLGERPATPLRSSPHASHNLKVLVQSSIAIVSDIIREYATPTSEDGLREPMLRLCDCFNELLATQLAQETNFTPLPSMQLPSHISKTVLLVDDSLVQLKILARHLYAVFYSGSKPSLNLLDETELNQNNFCFFDLINEAHAIRVFVANRAPMAKDIIDTMSKCIPISILFTDHEMPGMTGLELIEAVRAQEKLLNLAELKIVLLSGNSTLTINPSYNITYLVKPISMSSIKEHFEAGCDLQTSLTPRLG